MFGLFRAKSAPDLLVDPPHLGEGRRVYAIGDIHGRLDLLKDLIDMIAADDQARGSNGTTELIMLGDFVDRGPESAGVLDYLLRLRTWWPSITCLQGNHEEVFLMAARGDEAALRFMTRIGGRETLLSYGATENDLDQMTLGELRDWLMAAVPDAHLQFMESMSDRVLIGDYAFVHAGIRPRVPMEEQEGKDLRWIREEFLSFEQPHPYFVIHGHSITSGVDQKGNRMGIDTGAYASGVLTAVGLEGSDQWFLSTSGPGTGDFSGIDD
ncbi:putative hydrolase [Sphingobium sp. SYK-6]|uniref:metallophosphoesterase family protein n=1 Tax=Sphingobium sp. (strain NBRC 103272 / SYK-6) TaxID=627192 RepID=UPI0002277743|nr:metallophosphoesterase family protein [Sphingobium sp. SYK-6]BAK67917.1 putative hydrolase [Sphingobium sp. SYK-6]